FSCSVDHINLHSFPTRRSSDLKILREIDQQIADLITDMSDDDAVIVFSLHGMRSAAGVPWSLQELLCEKGFARTADWRAQSSRRSEEHTSELQSRENLVCRLLL